MQRRLVMVTDLAEGGAAITCRRLMTLLQGLSGWDVYWVVAGYGRGNNVVSAGNWPLLLPSLMMRFIFRYSANQRLRVRMQRYVSEINVAKCVQTLNPDVIMLHNIHDVATFSLIKRLPKEVPLVWRLADMWPLTGYCSHSFECREYVSGCNRKCEEQARWGPMLKSPASEWRRREKFYQASRHRLAFVAPSRWMAECATARFPGFHVETIANPVSLETFKPIRPKAEVRRILGLPVGIQIILAGAASVDNPDKGINYLLAALNMLKASEVNSVKVVAFGDKKAGASFPANWEMVGSIHDERLLNLYYNAADFYVSPTLAETFGLTLAEAVAAGTPAIVFNVGGCVDTVIDGVTGFVAEYRDSQSLANCIKLLLEMSEGDRERMSTRCRQFSEERYLAVPTVEMRYAALLENMFTARPLTLAHKR